MEFISDLQSLVKAVNLAEMAYAIERTTENKEKLEVARIAYKNALLRQSNKESNNAVVIASPEFEIVEDDNNCMWIVQTITQKCFASETALAWMCEISQGEISNMVRQSEKCPNALRGIDLSGMAKIKNPNSGKDIVAIPASVCSKVLYYYANKARGHEKRTRAQELCEAMIEAGSNVFIAKKAGYEFTLSQGRLFDEVTELKNRVAALEKQSLPGFDAEGKKNQYGETPQDAYFRRRDNWSEMWRISRLWRRNQD